VSDTDDEHGEIGNDDNFHEFGFQNLPNSASDSADDVDMEPCHSTDDEDNGPIKHDRLKIGDYVVVQLKGKKNVFHYVARVDDMVSEDLEISVTYLQTKNSKSDQELQRFSLPEAATSYQVPMEDVIKKLSVPIITGGTKRVSRQITFPVSLSSFNLA